MMDIVQVMEHADLWEALFRNPSWGPWKTAMRAMFGLPMSEVDVALYQECTGRITPPTKLCKETYLICGRRAGKSFMMATTACYLACFFDYKPYLNIGERATLMVIAADRKQARTIMRFIRGILQTPALARMVVSERAEAFDLNNRVTIEVHTASFSTTRGYTVCGCLIDEIAFIGTSDDAVISDKEIIRALRPAMALIPNAMLICASSPYARKGSLWTAYDKHYGKDASSVLVWRAPTTTMNPSFPQETVDQAIEEDLEAAKSEYLAEFRNDISSYIDADIVDSCILRGVYELPYRFDQTFVAFVDPSGGHSDSFTLGVATSRMDLDIQVCQLACIREWRPPFSPAQVIEEICQILRAYNINTVTSDRYGGEFPAELFRNHGVTLEPSEKSKSDLYRDALPLLNSGRIELLDNNRLVSQICNLERRVSRGGRDSIDHPPGYGPNAHDDVANSALGALVLASGMSADGFSLTMYMRAMGVLPTLEEERQMRKAQEAAERKAQEEQRAKEEAAQRESLEEQQSAPTEQPSTSNVRILQQ